MIFVKYFFYCFGVKTPSTFSFQKIFNNAIATYAEITYFIKGKQIHLNLLKNESYSSTEDENVSGNYLNPLTITKHIFKYHLTYFYFNLDNDGPYYWHIKSGTIQREVPAMPNNEKTEKTDKSNFSKETDNLIAKFESGIISSVTRSSTSSALDMELDDRKKKDDLAFK